MTEQTATTPVSGVAARQQAAEAGIQGLMDSITEQPEKTEDAPPETTQAQSQEAEDAEAPEDDEKAAKEDIPEPETDGEASEDREQPEEPEDDETDWIPSSLDELVEALGKEKDEFLADFKVPVTIEGETTEVPLGEALRGHLREATFTQKSQSLADERRQFEEARHQAATRWQQTTEALETAVSTLANIIPTDINPSDFVDHETGEFNSLAYEQAKAQADQVRTAMFDAYGAAEQARQQREQELATARDGYKTEQERHLRSRFPAFSDQAKWREFQDSASPYLQKHGFHENEVKAFFDNYDHRLMGVLKEAIDGHALKENKGKSLKKLKALPKPNPATAPASKGEQQRTRAANLKNKFLNAKDKRSRTRAAADWIGHAWGLDE